MTAPEFALDHPYDTILASGVLEHIAEPERVATGLRDYVDKSLAPTLPGLAYLPHRLRLLFESLAVQRVQHPGGPLHFRRLSAFTWWLDQSGGEVTSADASDGLRGLAVVRPSLFGNEMAVVARRR